MLTSLIKHIEERNNGEIIHDYEGVFSDEITEQSINKLEIKLTQLLGDGHTLKKRIIYLFVELFQNVIRHGHIQKGDVKPFGKASVKVQDKTCLISMYNYCAPNKTQALLTYIEELNDLTIDEIRKQYRLRLEQNTFSDKGGAGLGLIDMRRRTKNKIEVNVLNQPNELSVFCMILQVDLK